MSIKKPLISIVTSSWNREKYLKILVNSLKKQTYKNFEWVIGNDGSIDNTDKFIKSLSKKVKFKIIYINSSLRIGKAKMVNMLLENTSGKYISECDSDDYFLPKALENLIDITNQSYPKKDENFSGILAQNIDTKGISQTFKKNIPKKIEFVKWEDLHNNVTGDGSLLVLAKDYKKKKYLEVDFLITESSLLNKIFKNKTFLVSPKIVKIMNRKANNSVSFGNKIQYARGSVYCMAISETKKKFKQKKFIDKAITVINYWRYTFHGDINFNKALKMFKPIKDNYFYIIFYPISYIITLKDIFFNNIEKTHIEFEKNKNNSKIEIDIIN